MDTGPLWPLAVYFALVLFVAVAMLCSYFLGQRHTGRATREPYEGGIVSTGSARIRFDAKFYLVAMIFVIFDLEAVFIFAWAVAFRAVGWAGYVEVLIFIGVLVASFIYLWRMGALDWRPYRPRRVRLGTPPQSGGAERPGDVGTPERSS